MFVHPHPAGRSRERRHEPAASLGDRVEEAAFVVMLFSAATVVVTLLALLLII